MKVANCKSTYRIVRRQENARHRWKRLRCFVRPWHQATGSV